MREIKFRAFIKGKKETAKVNAIDFSLEKVRASYYDKELKNIITETYNFDEIELMQYTGLKDKEGEEIYKKDILKISNSEVGKVEFINGSFYFLAFPLKDDIRIASYFWNQVGVEVIGNIYENPELLETK